MIREGLETKGAATCFLIFGKWKMELKVETRSHFQLSPFLETMMNNYSLSKLACSALLLSGLLACGGGGGGKDPQDEDTGSAGVTDASINFPIEAATVAFLSRSSTYTLNANV
ncbi:MAG: hypothetical protein ACO1NO_06185, partial [Burkholderiaceae bacterium]